MEKKIQIVPITNYEGQQRNTAYIDVNTSLAPFVSFLTSDRFSIQNFLEFCNLAEAIVIYERLITTPHPCPADENPYFKSVDLDDITKLLLSEGILQFVTPPNLPNLGEQKESEVGKIFARNMSNYYRAAKKSNRGITYAYHVWPLGANTIHGVHLHPSLYEYPRYAAALQLEESVAATNSLVSAYRSMSRNLKSEVEQFSAKFPIYIPPIPALLLNKVTSPTEILNELLVLRTKFSRLRSAFKDYQETIEDEEITLKKSLKAQADLKQVCEEMSHPYQKRDITLISEWKDLVKLVPSDEDFDVTDAKNIVGLVLGKPLKLLASTLKRRKFLRLYRARDEFRKIRSMGKLVTKIWGVEISEEQIRIVKRYNNQLLESTPTKDEWIYPPKTSGFIWNK